MLTTSDPVAVANRLRPLLLRLHRDLRRELVATGVTAGQAALLHQIRVTPGVGVHELAVRERVSTPAMSGYVDRLAAAGLVERVRSESDRRRVGLRVTPAGGRLLRSVRSRRTAWLASRLRRLSASQMAALEAALEPMALLLEEDGA
ncbi:MAG TPA: MarR family transcriptional regulator [Gaiellales bacterium]|nr:MarR family transcriptional regulator [Gaiellales bacterium]